jgi:hypothetical protein
MTQTLKAGRSIEFRPSGFGTGYRLGPRPAFRYSKRADPATAKFFGVPALWVDTMDCD